MSDPSKLYPSLHRILHVEPYMLSHSPSTKPSSGGNNVWQRNTVDKRKIRHVRAVIYNNGHQFCIQGNVAHIIIVIMITIIIIIIIVNIVIIIINNNN